MKNAPFEKIKKAGKPSSPSGVASELMSLVDGDAPSLQEAHTRAPRTQQRILLVDDDPSTLRLLTKYLDDGGYEVLTAANGVEALRIILSKECPLVITDWMMPEMDGLDLCRAIRSSEDVGFAYVLILTAHTDEQSLANAFDAGADDFLRKPCQKSELLARLQAGVRALTAEAKVASQQQAAQKTNTELATLNDKLQLMATTDELTGLHNRREAIHRLDEYWASADREARPLACMLLDIDHFKRCNDTYGHEAGDAVLRDTARVLERFARAGETVFRIGGEEFVVLCPGATAEMAAQGAERLRAAVEANRTKRGEMSLGVTISVGVSERDHRTVKPEDLLRLADGALYEAKLSGRNRVCVIGTSGPVVSQPPQHEPEDVTGDDRGIVLVVDDDPSFRRLARKLLEGDGFEVHEACDGYEALTEAPKIHPDVILMDAVMPNLDGFECTRKLSADPSTCEIPVIMVSSRQTDEKHLEAGLDAGAKEYITKPLRHGEFVLRVRALTKLSCARKELVESNRVRGEQARSMGILFDLSRSLCADESRDSIVAHAATATAELMNSRRVSVMLPDDTGQNLFVAREIGIDDEVAAKIRVPLGSAIAGKVFASGDQAVLNSHSEAVGSNSRYESDFFASVPLVSKALAVPSKVVGILNVTERHGGRPFEAHEIGYLDLVCSMTAAALEQLQSGRAREHAHAAIVIGLAKLAEHRDSDTGKHLERVTQIALLIAKDLRKSSQYAAEIDDAFLEHLEQAVPLHDLGKVAVPDAIMLKPGRLNKAEFAVMKRHTIVGANAIQTVINEAPEVGFLPMAHDIAYGHHEWFDGSGYPQGLKEDQIPLPARLAAVADVYDALTTIRPYREALPCEKAVEIIRESSASHFDPVVVAAFLHVEKECADLLAQLEDGDGDSHEAEPGRLKLDNLNP